MTKAEFDRLMAVTYTEKHRAAYVLGFSCGLRISEITNLRQEDIDRGSGLIKVVQGKGGKDRVVPLPKGFKENMMNYIPLSCGNRSLQRAFKTAAERGKLLEKKPNLHFHSLRHGFATRLAVKKVPIHHIKILLGHSNISTTSIYLTANPEEALGDYEELF